MICYLGQFVISSGFALRSVVGDRLWPIFAMAALFGCARAFFQPTASALGPMLVPLRLLPRAIATNSLTAQFAMILGPALGRTALHGVAGGGLRGESPGFTLAPRRVRS